MARKIIGDLTGGVTDYHRHNTPDKALAECINWDIELDRSLKIRDPWIFFNDSTSTTQKPVGANAIDDIISFADELILREDDDAYNSSGSTTYGYGTDLGSELLDPTFNTGWSGDSNVTRPGTDLSFASGGSLDGYLYGYIGHSFSVTKDKYYKIKISFDHQKEYYDITGDGADVTFTFRNGLFNHNLVAGTKITVTDTSNASVLPNGEYVIHTVTASTFKVTYAGAASTTDCRVADYRKLTRLSLSKGLFQSHDEYYGKGHIWIRPVEQTIVFKATATGTNQLGMFLGMTEDHLDLDNLVAWGAALRTSMRAHMADGTEHASADTTNRAGLATEPTDLASLIQCITEMQTYYRNHEQDDDAGAGSYHNAIQNYSAAGSYYAPIQPPANVYDCWAYLRDFCFSFFYHDYDGGGGTSPHTVGDQYRPVFYDVTNASIQVDYCGCKEIEDDDGSTGTFGDITTEEIDYTEWRKHLIVTSADYVIPKKIFRNDTGNLKSIRTGLPSPKSQYAYDDGIYASNTISGSNAYTYAVVYAHRYTLEDGTTFLDLGPVNTLSVEDVVAPSLTHPIHINIPFLDSWDTSKVSALVYRTINNGTVFYYVGETGNYTNSSYGTNEYYVPDTFSYDDDLSVRSTLYTTDGTLQNNMPPRCKYVCTSNDIVWYANIYETTTKTDEYNGTSATTESYIENRVYQSAIADGDSVPDTNYIDVNEPIKGIESVNKFPIVFCDNKIYRLEGYFDDLGGGGITAVEIDSKAGCLTHKSIVKTDKLLYWAGLNGFYVTDGRTVQRISRALDETYSNLLSKINMKGCYDRENARVWWAVTVSGSKNNYIFKYDEKFGAFTKSTSQVTALQDITALTSTQTLQVIGTGGGYLYIQRSPLGSGSNKYGDDDLDTASNVVQKMPKWTIKLNEDHLGAPHNRKYVPRCLIDFMYDTFSTITCDVYSYDDGDNTSDGTKLTPIRLVRRGDFADGHGFKRAEKDSTITETNSRIQQAARYFDADKLRVWRKQLHLTTDNFRDGSVPLYWSSQENNSGVTFSTMNVADSASQTLTLSTGTFPTNIAGMKLITEAGTVFTISSRTDGSNILVSRVSGSGAETAASWAIYGEPIEVVRLRSIAIDHQVIGDKTADYNSATEVSGGGEQ